MRAKTKIIATLGPASSNATVMRKMFEAGLDVVRLNFSHGTANRHLQLIRLVRRINKKRGRRVHIMQDLAGFRVRVGYFPGGRPRQLKDRTVVWLTNDPTDEGPRRIPFDYVGDLAAIRPGYRVYIDDGRIALRVKQVAVRGIKAEVVEGGLLKQRKGINIPEATLVFDAITEKDRRDIEFGVAHCVDYVALSFVRRPDDVETAAALIKPQRPDCRIVAKIESREAIENVDQIIDVADGIMIARGDMGIAIPIHEVPIVQKTIIRKCNAAGKFVITATQMLEHMTEHSRPTRAEVTDVANAIIDGTDFVMLSGETAVGRHPDQCVRMMNEIIKFTEQHLPQLRRSRRGI